MIDLRSISEHQLLQFLSQQLNLPLLDISKRPISAEVVQLIPEVQARRFRALAVEDRGDSVLVAMSDPADLQALDHLEVLVAPKRLTLAVAPEQQLLEPLIIFIVVPIKSRRLPASSKKNTPLIKCLIWRV